MYDKDFVSLSQQPLDWFELLTRLFGSNLHSLMQRGMAHSYIQKEDTLPVMRGRWRIEYQLIHHPHTKHLFDLRYNEFSPDILLNQIFRFTVDNLLFHTQDPGNRRLLSDLQDWLTPVLKKGQISSQELDQVVFTRLIERYHPAFNIARMFIEHSTPMLSSGKTTSFAFVFDMNVLFEQFIAQFIKR
ncbi:MAG: hypothetical protein RQ760_09295, partial [Sedimentisphaerales bacterium]|nr:hypothetical protein [Sedimentisphaerales bacterium]